MSKLFRQLDGWIIDHVAQPVLDWLEVTPRVAARRMAQVFAVTMLVDVGLHWQVLREVDVIDLVIATVVWLVPASEGTAERWSPWMLFWRMFCLAMLAVPFDVTAGWQALYTLENALFLAMMYAAACQPPRPKNKSVFNHYSAVWS